MKTIFITGSSRGIGKCLGLYCKQKNYNVIFNGTSKPLSDIDINKEYLKQDITKCTGIELLDKVINLCGVVPDILVCNAGYLGVNSEKNENERCKELNVNLLSNISLIDSAVKIGVKKIVVITSDNKISEAKDNGAATKIKDSVCIDGFH